MCCLFAMAWFATGCVCSYALFKQHPSIHARVLYMFFMLKLLSYGGGNSAVYGGCGGGGRVSAWSPLVTVFKCLLMAIISIFMLSTKFLYD